MGHSDGRLVEVLDKGYVRLIDHMGSDLSFVNAARASFAKESEKLDEKDKKLLAFLLRENHISPFRHAFLTFEFKAPLMVARQHWKYVVGSDHTMDSWNESCFPGDQMVVAYPYASGNRKHYSVQELHELAQRNKNYLPRVPSLGANGTIVPNKIKDIWAVGEAEVFEVEVSTGVKIRTTSNHRYLTPSGYKELKDLVVGDQIMGNGIPAYKSAEWLSEQYIIKGKTQDEIANLAGCSTHTIRKWVRIHKLQQNQVARLQAYNKLHGVFGKGLTAATSAVIAKRSAESGAAQKGKPKARGQANGNFKFDEAKDPTTGRYRARRLISDPVCSICGAKAQIHHKDGDPFNNNESNLATLCQGHYDIAHGKAPLLVPHPVVITSIRSIGIMPVYDIEMTDEPNLVVSNVIVHNSRRYITQEPEFYIPDSAEWRSAPDNRKQGSGPPLDADKGVYWSEKLMNFLEEGENLYNDAMQAGIAAEQARLFLPAYGMYVNYRWSCSFQSLMLFLNQRLEEDSQKEIQDYAKAVYELVKDIFPVSIDLLMEVRNNG